MLSDQVKRILDQNRGEISALEGNILSAAKGKEIKSIFVTSCRPGEGKTVSAVVVANALSEAANARVLLADVNLRSPKVHDLFGVESTPGLTDLLLSRKSEDEAIKGTEYPRLSILPCGTPQENLSDAFKPDTFAQKLASLRSKFDYVLCDGESVLSSSLVPMIARYFDGIIVIVECEKTKWEVLDLAKEKIANVGGNVLGVALNKRQYYIPRGLYDKI